MFKEVNQREVTIGEIFSGGWEIYSKNFIAILIIILLVYIPINTVLFVLGKSSPDLNDLKIYLDIVRLLEGLVGIIATMGIAIIVEKSITSQEGEEISWILALKKSLSRWVSCVGTDILAGFIVFGLLLLLVVPGLIWMLYYAFVVQVVILKGLGGKEALDYSKSLVKGQWWTVFGVLLVFNLVNFIIGLIISFLLGFLPDSASIISDTVIDIIGAYFTVLTTLYFINTDYLKGRKEALGITE